MKCKNCGANLKQNENYCIYCGAINTEKTTNNKTTVSDASLNAMLQKSDKQMLLNESLKMLNAEPLGKAPLILFGIIWVIVALTIAFSTFSFGGIGIPFGIIAILMGVFGIITIFNKTKLPNFIKGDNINDLNTLLNAKNYEKAYDLLEKKLSKSNNLFTNQDYLIQLILLDYYKFQNYEKAKERILILERHYDELPSSILRIAKELNIDLSHLKFN